MKRKIFCVSLSRNGTTSFHNYMESFGLKSIHYPRVLFTQMEKVGQEIPKKKPKLSIVGRVLLSRLIQKENKQDALEVLENFEAFSDLPINLLYKSLSKIYPNAIFILIERDIEKWLKSMKWILEEQALFPNDHLGKLINYVTYGTISFNRELLTEVYKKHGRECKRFFKTNKNFYTLNLDKGELNEERLSQILNLQAKIKTGKLVKYPSKSNSVIVNQIFKIVRRIDVFDIIYLGYKAIKKIK